MHALSAQIEFHPFTELENLERSEICERYLLQQFHQGLGSTIDTDKRADDNGRL